VSVKSSGSENDSRFGAFKTGVLIEKSVVLEIFVKALIKLVRAPSVAFLPVTFLESLHTKRAVTRLESTQLACDHICSDHDCNPK